MRKLGQFSANALVAIRLATQDGVCVYIKSNDNMCSIHIVPLGRASAATHNPLARQYGQCSSINVVL